jgi:hypothetical protein
VGSHARSCLTSSPVPGPGGKPLGTRASVSRQNLARRYMQASEGELARHPKLWSEPTDSPPSRYRAIVGTLRASRKLKGGGERGIRTLGRVSPTHAFQACSIDHSDISPFRINDLRAARIRIAQNPPSRISDFTCRMVPIGYGDAREVVDRNCVRPSNVVGSLTAISLGFLLRGPLAADCNDRLDRLDAAQMARDLEGRRRPSRAHRR